MQQPTERKTIEEIRQMLIQARTQVPEGAIYEHSSNRRYRVRCVAMRQEDFEPSVIYTSLVAPFIGWDCKLSLFLQQFRLLGSEKLLTDMATEFCQVIGDGGHYVEPGVARFWLAKAFGEGVKEAEGYYRTLHETDRQTVLGIEPE